MNRDLWAININKSNKLPAYFFIVVVRVSTIDIRDVQRYYILCLQEVPSKGTYCLSKNYFPTITSAQIYQVSTIYYSASACSTAWWSHHTQYLYVSLLVANVSQYHPFLSQ